MTLTIRVNDQKKAKNDGWPSNSRVACLQTVTVSRGGSVVRDAVTFCLWIESGDGDLIQMIQHPLHHRRSTTQTTFRIVLQKSFRQCQKIFVANAQ